MGEFPKPLPMSAEEAAEIFKCEWVSPPQEPFPPEADGNYGHPYWAFLDRPIWIRGKMRLPELVP